MTISAFQYKTLDCLDEADNVLFSRQLETILPDLITEDIAPTSVRAMFPVNTAFSPNTKTVTWRMLTITGAAKIIADYADDIPLINMFGEEKSTKVQTLAVGTEFSVDELSASAEGGISLASEGPVAARDSILRKENVLAYEGVIYTEMASLVGDVHTDSKTIHSPSRILMSPANFQIISTTQFSAATDTTILGFFRANHPGVDVQAVQEFSGAGAKGGMGAANDAVFAYNPNPSEIQLAVIMAIEQRAPTELRLKIETIYRSKVGGFIIRKPLAMKFLTGT